MLKHLRAIRQRLRERRDYEMLVTQLERINAEDVSTMGRAVVPQQGARQVFGGGRR